MTPADDYLSPQAFWFILLAGVVGCVVLAILRAEHRRAYRAQARADLEAEARREPDRVDPLCALLGHSPVAHQTVWLCECCGERIPRDTLDQEPA